MNKKAYEKLIPLSKVIEELNFSPQEDAEIAENIRMYDLMNEIREIKKEKSLNNQKLSELSGIPRPEVSKILNGRVNVSVKRLMALARAMGKKLEIKLV